MLAYESCDRYYEANKFYLDKEKYVKSEEGKTAKLAKILAKAELESMQVWPSIYDNLNFNND